MRFRRTVSAFLATGAVVLGSVAAAPQASAAEPCGAGKLCLYRSTLYRTMMFETGRTARCFRLADYHLGPGLYSIWSYDNNLPVKVDYWKATETTAYLVGTTSPGGSSSNTSQALDEANLMCTGGAGPYWPPVLEEV
ncbi:peptidase inhibitor [Streptomyces vilmorinianum]|uniref:peptidase inhibitor n=1 Tax=Streptomyces vilmorinianum TaxID=3051092 RepID=UPI0010FB95A2|nr:peptidase inhibitor [Streptomyces vilmorinianum]